MQPGLDFDATTRALMILGGLFLLILTACAMAWAWALARWGRELPVLPRRSQRPVPWGASGVFIGFLVWMVATTIAQSVLIARRAGQADERVLIDAMIAVSLVNFAVIVILPLLLRAWYGASASDFGLRPRTMVSDLTLGVWAALFFAPLVYLVQFLAVLIWRPTPHPLQDMLFENRSASVAALAVLSAVLMAPAAEELLFRGVFQGWLEKRRPGSRSTPEPLPSPEDQEGQGMEQLPSADLGAGPSPDVVETAPSDHSNTDSSIDPRALIVPAALFAAVHFGQWPAPLPLFVLAMGLGLLYHRTRGIIAPIAMHATFNGLSTLVMIVTVQLGIEIPEPGPAIPDSPPPAERIGGENDAERQIEVAQDGD